MAHKTKCRICGMVVDRDAEVTSLCTRCLEVDIRIASDMPLKALTYFGSKITLIIARKPGVAE